MEFVRAKMIENIKENGNFTYYRNSITSNKLKICTVTEGRPEKGVSLCFLDWVIPPVSITFLGF